MQHLLKGPDPGTTVHLPEPELFPVEVHLRVAIAAALGAIAALARFVDSCTDVAVRPGKVSSFQWVYWDDCSFSD